MKTDVTDVNASTQWNTEGLNRAVEILIVKSVFIVPHTGHWICNLVPDESDAVISRVRLDLAQRCASRRPCHYGGAPPNRVTKSRKSEVRCPVHRELAIGDVVIHVALPGMIVAPVVFMRGNILRFGEVRCALVKALI